jgi:hypothetical protein
LFLQLCRCSLKRLGSAAVTRQYAAKLYPSCSAGPRRDTSPRANAASNQPKLRFGLGGFMDYFIVAITSIAGLYFHWWLYVRIKRWMDRDLALSLAGDSTAKRNYMLARLAEAQAAGIKRNDLPAWLEQAAAQYSGD